MITPEPYRRAIEILSTVTRADPRQWRVVAHFITMRLAGVPDAPKWVAKYAALLKPDVWYDFADPKTGAYGQCRMKADGSWHQEPRGEAPVVLEWLGNPRGAA
jgi:hypothetical protein